LGPLKADNRVKLEAGPTPSPARVARETSAIAKCLIGEREGSQGEDASLSTISTVYVS